MAISAAQVKLYKTTNGLGGAITATESVSNQSGNVWDAFSGAETAAGGTFYACLYIKNESPESLTMQSVIAHIASETDHNGVNVSIGAGTAAVNATEQTIADETTAPAGVTFVDTDTTTSGAVTDDGDVALPNIPANQHKAIWLRMVIDAGTTAVTGYQANVEIDFDTAA